MNEIQNCLKNLYLRAGIKISVDREGQMTFLYDNLNMNKIYDVIMDLRDTNYQFYLKVLGVLMFTFPEDYEVEAEEYGDLLKIYNIRDYTSSIEEVDAILYENDFFGVITILIRANLELAFENDLEHLWFMLCQDVEALPSKAKFLGRTELMDVFKRSVCYSVMYCPEVLMDLLQIFYYVTRDMKNSYLLNAYIVAEILRRNDKDALAIYMFGIFWNQYQQGVWNAPRLTDKKIVSYLSSFESNKRYRKNQYNNFITSPEKTRVIQYFLEYEVSFDTLKDIKDTENKHKNNMEEFKKRLDKEIQEFVGGLNFGKRI